MLNTGSVPVSTASDVRHAAAVLRMLLAKVQAGELDASAGLVRRAEGALAALDAMTSRGKRQ